MSFNETSNGRTAIVAMTGGIGAVAAVVHQPEAAQTKTEDKMVKLKKTGTIKKKKLLQKLGNLRERERSPSISSDSSFDDTSYYYKDQESAIWFADALDEPNDTNGGNTEEPIMDQNNNLEPEREEEEKKALTCYEKICVCCCCTR